MELKKIRRKLAIDEQRAAESKVRSGKHRGLNDQARVKWSPTHLQTAHRSRKDSFFSRSTTVSKSVER